MNDDDLYCWNELELPNDTDFTAHVHRCTERVASHDRYHRCGICGLKWRSS